jgi:hypothetical protein
MAGFGVISVGPSESDGRVLHVSIQQIFTGIIPSIPIHYDFHIKCYG